MMNYDPAALPSINITDVVTVKMGIALFQIRELVGMNRNEHATYHSTVGIKLILGPREYNTAFDDNDDDDDDVKQLNN